MTSPAPVIRVAAVAAATIASTIVAAAPQRAAFRGSTEVVAVYATVLDKQTKRLVTDLPQDAFEVLDNGRRQEVSIFSSEVQPITVVIMLDRSASMLPFADVVRRGAEAFVDRMLPEDRARVGDFSHQVRIHPEEFTGDPKQLLWNLRTNLQTGRNGPSPVWTAVDQSMSALTSEGGRRVVLLFSDGHDDPGYGQHRVSFKDLQRRVVEDEIMIYAIAVPSSQANPWVGPQNPADTLRAGVRFQPPDPDLRKIAEDSGGGYFELEWREDLNAAFARVADELHRQYLLGFTPSTLDGRAHNIEVRVKDRAVTVRARKSYLARK